MSGMVYGIVFVSEHIMVSEKVIVSDNTIVAELIIVFETITGTVVDFVVPIVCEHDLDAIEQSHDVLLRKVICRCSGVLRVWFRSCSRGFDSDHAAHEV